MLNRTIGCRCGVCGAYCPNAEAADLCQKRSVVPPRFRTGDRVRTSFFYQYFRDGHEGQNRFEVVGESGLKPSRDEISHERIYQVKMLVKPFAVLDLGDGELDPLA